MILITYLSLSFNISMKTWSFPIVRVEDMRSCTKPRFLFPLIKPVSSSRRCDRFKRSMTGPFTTDSWRVILPCFSLRLIAWRFSRAEVSIPFTAQAVEDEVVHHRTGSDSTF